MYVSVQPFIKIVLSGSQLSQVSRLGDRISDQGSDFWTDTSCLDWYLGVWIGIQLSGLGFGCLD